MMRMGWTWASVVNVGLERWPSTSLPNLWEQTGNRSIVKRWWLGIRMLNNLRLSDGWLNILRLTVCRLSGERLQILGSNSSISCWGGSNAVRSYWMSEWYPS